MITVQRLLLNLNINEVNLAFLNHSKQVKLLRTTTNQPPKKVMSTARAFRPCLAMDF